MGVVNDILDFSKLEAEKLHPEYIRFSPEAAIEKAFNISSFNAYEKGLEPTLHIGPAMPRYLMGDPLRIQQIIINLLSNAVKFTQQGSISLKVTYDTDTCKPHYLQVVVTDTGIGMTPEQQKRLFIPFNQADNSITRNYGGTGLGLMICKKLSELMGGTITVNSQPGKGSCFTVRVPLDIAQEEPDQSSSHQDKADNTEFREQPLHVPNLSAYRLLLVDDNPINQQVAAGFLQDSGIHIDIAGDGEVAIEKIRHASYDIILMDLQMPKMDGISATRQIRTTLNQSIPIIALTAHANEVTIRDCLENGMNAHLSKPLDADNLYRTLTDYLNADTSSANRSELVSGEVGNHSVSLLNKLVSVCALNVEEALNRLHHSNELLLSLVQSFYSRYADSQLLTQGSNALSPEQLADEVHSLKSNCAYIGAQKLSSQCTVMEQKLRSGEPVNAERLIDGLRALITSLHPLFGTESERPQNSAQKEVPLKSCLATMEAQLEQSDFRVEQTLLQIKANLTDDKRLSESIAHIEALVEDVEFEQALEVSKLLIASFNGTGTVVDGK
jgi:CheY-like chemotaxis protein/anti-sigma regulatory factor (Ser/Thr protein kinase)